MLGPLFFLIYINDLDDNITSNVLKFADDTKVFRKVNIHTWHRNLDINYTIGDTVLGTIVKEKDLGITISADMKVSEQCGIAASRGNHILGLIRGNMTYKEKS